MQSTTQCKSPITLIEEEEMLSRSSLKPAFSPPRLCSLVPSIRAGQINDIDSEIRMTVDSTNFIIGRIS